MHSEMITMGIQCKARRIEQPQRAATGANTAAHKVCHTQYIGPAGRVSIHSVFKHNDSFHSVIEPAQIVPNEPISSDNSMQRVGLRYRCSIDALRSSPLFVGACVCAVRAIIPLFAR